MLDRRQDRPASRPQGATPKVPMQNTFAQEALRYSSLGLVPILLVPNGKAALLPGWPRLRPRTLLKQFDRSQGNLGLRLGKQADGRVLLVIDVDTKRGGTLGRLTQNRQFPSTATTLTAGGGFHYWLAVPSQFAVRSRVDFVSGIDVLGERSLAVSEPSVINEKEYVWLYPPSQGISPAPGWLLASLRGAGLLVRRHSQRGRTAQNGQARPQRSPRPKKEPREASEESGLLAETLSRFPLLAPGTRENQLARLICSLVCDPRQFQDDVINDISLAWWRHWYGQGLCRTPPDARTIKTKLAHCRRSHSLGKISTMSNRYGPLRAAVSRPPFLPFGGNGGARGKGLPLGQDRNRVCGIAAGSLCAGEPGGAPA